MPGMQDVPSTKDVLGAISVPLVGLNIPNRIR